MGRSFRPTPRWSLPLLILAVLLTMGCGGRTSTTESTILDTECKQLDWDSCVEIGTPRTLVVDGDIPSLVWTGKVFILGYQQRDINLSVVPPLPPLAMVFDGDGNLPAATTPTLGMNGLTLAYHPVLDRAVGISDGGAVWFDGDGVLLGTEPASGGTIFSGDLSLIEDGFLAVTGNFDSPARAYYAHIGATQEPLQFNTLLSRDGFGQFAIAHDVSPNGLAKKVSVSNFYTPEKLLYDIPPTGVPELVADVSARVPTSNNGFFLSHFAAKDRLFGLYGGTLPDPSDTWAMWLVDLSTPTAPTWRIDRAPNGPEAAVLMLGSDLVIASPTVHPDFRMSLARLSPGSDQPVGKLTVIARINKFSRSSSVTQTPRGFAIVWVEMDNWAPGTQIADLPKTEIRFSQFDCCAH